MKITIKLLLLFALALTSVSTLSKGAMPSLPWDVEKFKKAPQTFPEPKITGKDVTSIYFQGPDYQGKPTRIFAFYGIPHRSDGQKVPGIVLVHGAGGTAFADWVRLWNSRGYAAIAFDHAGGLPVGTMGKWQPNPDGGPGIGKVDGAPEDSWVYHVVADSMLAASLLQSFPEVDPDRIGLTGISWGGVAASAVAGFDDRLKFVVPVYGCGFVDYKAPDDPAPFLPTPWDPSNFLPHTKAAMLWLNGTNDHFFTMKATIQSYHAASATPHALCFRVRMPHGQYGVGSEAPEILAFANSIVSDGVPMAHILDKGTDQGQGWVTYESPRPIVKAEMIYTRDTGLWEKRNFVSAEATIDDANAQKKISHEIVEGTTGYFFNLIDDRNLIVSSEYVSLPPPTAAAK